MTISWRWAWVVLAGATALTAGCTSPMSRAAQHDPGFTPGVTDTALLDSGNFHTTPHLMLAAS